MTRVLADWRTWLALVGTAGAFAVAAILSATTNRSWRAETAIVVGTGSGPLRPGEGGATRDLANRLDDLVRSDQIAANVISTLHLRESRASLLHRIAVSVPEPGLLRVRVTDRDRLRAPQIAQEIGFLFPQLVEHRFPRLKAVVWDPAHLVGRSGRHWGRNVGIAGAVSVLFWVVALVPLARLERARVPVRVPETPASQRAPAPPPAAPPAAAPAEEPAPAPEPTPSPEPTPEPAAVRQAEPTAVLQPEPVAAPQPAAVDAEPGEWNLPDLERLVREHAGDFPDRTDEWEIYLDSMRPYADADGRLPATFDWLVWDTFGEVLERGRG